jgi:hypothetical protein
LELVLEQLVLHSSAWGRGHLCLCFQKNAFALSSFNRGVRVWLTAEEHACAFESLRFESLRFESLWLFVIAGYLMA